MYPVYSVTYLSGRSPGSAARTGTFPIPLIRELPGCAGVPPAWRAEGLHPRSRFARGRRDAGAPRGGTPLPTSPLKGGGEKTARPASRSAVESVPERGPLTPPPFRGGEVKADSQVRLPCRISQGDRIWKFCGGWAAVRPRSVPRPDSSPCPAERSEDGASTAIAPPGLPRFEEAGPSREASGRRPCRRRSLPRRPGKGKWWSQGESNPRPLECHSSALPAELWPREIRAGGRGPEQYYPNRAARGKREFPPSAVRLAVVLRVRFRFGPGRRRGRAAALRPVQRPAVGGRPAARADGRVAPEIVEPRPAAGAGPLRTPFRLRHHALRMPRGAGPLPRTATEVKADFAPCRRGARPC